MSDYEMIARLKNPNPGRTAWKRKVITTLFNDHPSYERAFKSLYQHGYTGRGEEINVTKYDEICDKHFSVQDRIEDSDNEIIRKVVKGILAGGVFGSVTLGVVLGILLGAWLDNPVLTFLSGMVLGFAWGGIMGMIIGPQLPLVHKKNFELTLLKNNVLLSFRPKNREDEGYLKIKIGIPTA